MSIDWFTVAAQIINFLILVWLLKLVLYRPILDAIDARERRIASTLEDAADKQSSADQERELFSQKNDEFEQQRKALLDTAAAAADAQSRSLLEEARQAADALTLQRQKIMQQQQQSLSFELSRKTQEEVFAISRRALSDLADTDLEEQMLKVFLTRLAELDKNSRETLFSAISAAGKPVRIRSTFALQPTQQKRISSALQENLTADIEIHFETAPEVICGIELTIDGQKLAWSIAQYIKSLEKHLQQLVHKPLTKQSINDAQHTAQSASLQQELTTKKTNHDYE